MGMAVVAGNPSGRARYESLGPLGQDPTSPGVLLRTRANPANERYAERQAAQNVWSETKPDSKQ